MGSNRSSRGRWLVALMLQQRLQGSHIGSQVVVLHGQRSAAGGWACQASGIGFLKAMCGSAAEKSAACLRHGITYSAPILEPPPPGKPMHMVSPPPPPHPHPCAMFRKQLCARAIARNHSPEGCTGQATPYHLEHAAAQQQAVEGLKGGHLLEAVHSQASCIKATCAGM